MYSAFNSNITTHLDSFRQMKPSFLINSANKNIYSFVSHITVSIILVKHDLLLRDNYGFRTGYFSYEAGRSEEWTSSGGQLQYQQHWPRTVSHGDRAEEPEVETRSWRRYSGQAWELSRRPSDARKGSPEFSLGPTWNLSPFFPTSRNHTLPLKISPSFLLPSSLQMLWPPHQACLYPSPPPALALCSLWCFWPANYNYCWFTEVS